MKPLEPVVNQYEGWVQAKVGCHWTRGPWSVSTIQTGDGKRSGYVLTKDRHVVAEFVGWDEVLAIVAAHEA